MAGRPITVSDLLATTGYTRDQMRGLLDAMPAYASRDTKVRVAKQYSAQDLLVIAACSRLETHHGLQRAAVAAFSQLLASVLSGPRPVSSSPFLLLTFNPWGVRYLESLDEMQDGLLVALKPIFFAVDSYLIPDHANAAWSQRELGFGPRAVHVPPAKGSEVQQVSRQPRAHSNRRSS